jgi:BON domain
MKRIFLALPLLVLATTVALAQAPDPQQTSPSSNKPGQTSQSETQNNAAGSISGNASPTNAAPTTANSNPTTPDPTAPTTDKPAAPPQQEKPQGQSPSLPQGSAPMPSSNVSDSASLKGQLDQAYQSEPSLSGSNIQVEVTDTAIQLSGSVPTAKEKTTAKRIAQSYSGNRKVVEKLAVTGRTNSTGAPANPPKQ